MNSESILVSCYYRRQSVTSYSTHMSYTPEQGFKTANKQHIVS